MVWGLNLQSTPATSENAALWKNSIGMKAWLTRMIRGRGMSVSCPSTVTVAESTANATCRPRKVRRTCPWTAYQ